MKMKYFVEEFSAVKPWNPTITMYFTEERPWAGERAGSSSKRFEDLKVMYPEGKFNSYIKVIECDEI